MDILYIVIPCYNEEEVLPETSQMFLEELELLINKKKISDASRILFVNDGSKDETWNIISDLSTKDQHFIGMSLSRNRGHQNALLGGLMEAKNYADIVISIDADGQDDIGAMEEMVDAYHNGNDIVYGVRKKRDTDTFFKRTTAQGFYRFLNMMGVEVVYNHADYRLTSKVVLEDLSNFKEVNLFLRGMVPLVGYSSTSVYYDRHERLAGESHYPLSKMLHLAIDGITSFSIKPLTLISQMGLIVAFISFIGVIYTLVCYFLGNTVDGWASILCGIFFLGGVQLIAIGVLGTYIGKIYLETKQRPRYIVSKYTYRKKSSHD